VKQLAVVLITVAVASCATDTLWRHSYLSGPEAERDFLIADGRCAKEAQGIAVPQAVTPQTAYQVTGTSQTTYGAGATDTRITAEARPDVGPLALAQHVQAAGEQGAAQGARRRVYTGCMAEAGWVRNQ
jgi:hypothetical protein